MYVVLDFISYNSAALILIYNLATNSGIEINLHLFLVCSGLAIVSRFPILEYEFNSYTYHGDPLKALIDGEWFARKGVGRIRIEPLPNVTVSVSLPS